MILYALPNHPPPSVQLNMAFFATISVLTMHPSRLGPLTSMFGRRMRLVPGVPYNVSGCAPALPMQGCSLGHVKILRQIAKAPGGWHLIFEDDATPSGWALAHDDWPEQLIAAAPPGVQAINLGPGALPLSFGLRKWAQTRLGRTLLVEPGFHQLMHAYMVQPAAAATMADAIMEHLCDQACDVTMESLNTPWQAQAHLPPSLAQWPPRRLKKKYGVFAQSMHTSDVQVS